MFDSYTRYVALLVILLGSGAFTKAMDDPRPPAADKANTRAQNKSASQVSKPFQFIPNVLSLRLVQVIREDSLQNQPSEMQSYIDSFIQIWTDYKKNGLPQSSRKMPFPIKIINDLYVVQALLVLEQDVQRNKEMCRTLFFEAAAAGELVILQFFINNGYDVNQRDCISATALYYAIGRGQRLAAEMLIKHGAELEKNCRPFGDPLTYALSCHQDGIARVIRDALFGRSGQVNRQSEIDQPVVRELPSSSRLTLQIMLDQRRRDQGRDQATDFQPWRFLSQ